MRITIGIAEDYQLLLKSLKILIESFHSYEVVLEALNGQELVNKLDNDKVRPDILLLDVKMPIMSGLEAAKQINEKYPAIKLVALSTQDDEMTIINMIRAGCCAYLFKGINDTEFEKALQEIVTKGYYNGDAANINYRRLLKKAYEVETFNLTKQEKVFLVLACSELTYRQIASKMKLSERTVDGYRESLFEKFAVQSRVGMVLEAIKRKIITIEEL